jgi:hypothetical protein
MIAAADPPVPVEAMDTGAPSTDAPHASLSSPIIAVPIVAAATMNPPVEADAVHGEPLPAVQPPADSSASSASPPPPSSDPAPPSSPTSGSSPRSSSSLSRSATVKQRARRHKSAARALPLLLSASVEEEAPLPALSSAELAAESAAHRHRLALERPAFIERRRAEEAQRQREPGSSRLVRWPYVDARNVEVWRREKQEQRDREEQERQEKAAGERRIAEAEQAQQMQMEGEERKEGSVETDGPLAKTEDERKEADEKPQSPAEQHQAAPVEELKEAAASVAGELQEVEASKAEAVPTEERKESSAAADDEVADAAETLTDGAGEGEETEDDEPQLLGGATVSTGGRHKKRRPAVWSSSSSKKRQRKRSLSASPPPPPSSLASLPSPSPLQSPSSSPSSASNPYSLSSSSRHPFPAPVHHEFGYFAPTLMLGNRVHYFDRLTRLPRDGELLSYSLPRRAFHVRLDPTAEEEARGMGDDRMMRWLRVEEQEVWEYVDVAWCRHPEKAGSMKSWWPCEVVRLYREGQLVQAADLAKEDSSSRSSRQDDDDETEDEDDAEAAGSRKEERQAARSDVIIHLLGAAEDSRLFSLPHDAVMSWQEGVAAGCHLRASKSMLQALRDGEWTWHFHLQKWSSRQTSHSEQQTATATPSLPVCCNSSAHCVCAVSLSAPCCCQDEPGAREAAALRCSAA